MKVMKVKGSCRMTRLDALHLSSSCIKLNHNREVAIACRILCQDSGKKEGDEGQGNTAKAGLSCSYVRSPLHFLLLLPSPFLSPSCPHPPLPHLCSHPSGFSFFASLFSISPAGEQRRFFTPEANHSDSMSEASSQQPE